MLAIALGAMLLTGEVAELNVDRIELNHFGGDDSHAQHILWTWCTDCHDWHCEGWIMADKCQPIVKVRGRYVTTWRKDGRRYRATAPAFPETWTEGDPELDDRKKYDPDKRLLERLERAAQRTP